MSAAIRSRAAPLRAASTTRAPWAAALRAVASPIPDEAPSRRSSGPRGVCAAWPAFPKLTRPAGRSGWLPPRLRSSFPVVRASRVGQRRRFRVSPENRDDSAIGGKGLALGQARRVLFTGTLLALVAGGRLRHDAAGRHRHPRRVARVPGRPPARPDAGPRRPASRAAHRRRGRAHNRGASPPPSGRGRHRHEGPAGGAASARIHRLRQPSSTSPASPNSRTATPGRWPPSRPPRPAPRSR